MKNGFKIQNLTQELINTSDPPLPWQTKYNSKEIKVTKCVNCKKNYNVFVKKKKRWSCRQIKFEEVTAVSFGGESTKFPAAFNCFDH